MHSTAGVVDQLGQVAARAAAGPDAHFEGVEGEVGVQARGQLPAHDPAGEHVDHEHRVDPAGEGSDVGDVLDPETIQRRRDKPPLDEIPWTIRQRPGDGRAGPFRAADSAQTLGPHEPFDRAPGRGMPRYNWAWTFRTP